MKKEKLSLLAATIIVMVFIFFSFSAAWAIEIEDPLGKGANFNTIINNLVRFANSILAPLSTLMILIAGFLYMTGGGIPEKIKTAHKVLIWALVGIGIVLLANGAEAIIRSILRV